MEMPYFPLTFPCLIRAGLGFWIGWRRNPLTRSDKCLQITGREFYAHPEKTYPLQKKISEQDKPLLKTTQVRNVTKTQTGFLMFKSFFLFEGGKLSFSFLPFFF